jgi:hypothetical protein
MPWVRLSVPRAPSDASAALEPARHWRIGLWIARGRRRVCLGGLARGLARSQRSASALGQAIRQRLGALDEEAQVVAQGTALGRRLREQPAGLLARLLESRDADIGVLCRAVEAIDQLLKLGLVVSPSGEPPIENRRVRDRYAEQHDHQRVQR